MNNTELIEVISEIEGLSKSDVSRVLNTLASTVRSSLKHDEEVRVSGLGTFFSKKHAARKVTAFGGKEVAVPEKLMPKFRPSKALKDFIA